MIIFSISFSVVSQVFHDLDQMHQDADKKSSKATDLYSALAQKAKDRGFEVSENCGQGDCMFYALSEQLELVKGITLSAEKLRKELVQYLKENPKLVSTLKKSFTAKGKFATQAKK